MNKQTPSEIPEQAIQRARKNKEKREKALDKNVPLPPSTGGMIAGKPKDIK